jgi:transposase
VGRQRARTYSDEFKIAAVQRVMAGERVAALAAELGIKPQLLYRWWDNVEFAGAVTLRPGRPAKAAAPPRKAAPAATGGDERVPARRRAGAAPPSP